MASGAVYSIVIYSGAMAELSSLVHFMVWKKWSPSLVLKVIQQGHGSLVKCHHLTAID